MEDDAFEASLADLVAGDGGGLAELLADASTPAQEGFVFAPCSYSLHPGAGEKWLAPSSASRASGPPGEEWLAGEAAETANPLPPRIFPRHLFPALPAY